MPHIVLVAAVGKNRAIGRGGKLPWRLADDLKRFKSLTTGHAVLMGRKTFASLPHGALPLRRNLVLSRTQADFPGAETFSSLEAALAAAGEGTVFAIGGERVYREAMPLADAMHLTLVDDAPDADAFFPAWNPAEWEETSRTPHPADARNEKAFAFAEFRRRR
jgi:dihydrofolate reductase